MASNDNPPFAAGPADHSSAVPPRSPFAARPGDVRALIDAFPLAWVVPRAGGAGEASLLPLVGIYDAAGEPVELIGHFALSNPIGAALARDSRALILFTGPHGYMSPAMAGKRDWGPTWNYAQARIEAEILVEPNLTDEAVQRLIDHVERCRAQPWKSEDLGDRYHALASRIVGFRARVLSVEAKFKLGQDETRPVLDALLAGLSEGRGEGEADDVGEAGLAGWMARFNAERLSDGG